MGRGTHVHACAVKWLLDMRAKCAWALSPPDPRCASSSPLALQVGINIPIPVPLPFFSFTGGRPVCPMASWSRVGSNRVLPLTVPRVAATLQMSHQILTLAAVGPVLLIHPPATRHTHIHHPLPSYRLARLVCRRPSDVWENGRAVLHAHQDRHRQLESERGGGRGHPRLGRRG